MTDQPDRDIEPVFYSQVAAAAMHDELNRLRSEQIRMSEDVAYWQRQTNRWYMRANYTPEQIAEFHRRLSKGFDQDGESLPLSGRFEETENGDNGVNGTVSTVPANEPPRATEVSNGADVGTRSDEGGGEEPSRITRTGNLAAVPKLHTGERGDYTYVRILVTDRFRQDDGSYANGSTTAYDVAVSGRQARELVAAAERSGNIRVMFSGRYRVTERAGEKGATYRHEVRADQIGISLRGQSVTVERGTSTR